MLGTKVTQLLVMRADKSEFASCGKSAKWRSQRLSWRHGMRPDPRGPAFLWLHPRQSEQLSQPLPVLSLTSDPGAAMARRLQYWALMLQCKDTSHRWRVSWIRLYTAAAHTNRIAHVETEKAKNSTKDVRAYGKSPDSISRGWFLSSRHDEYVSGFWSL